jgi:hypothetical protein
LWGKRRAIHRPTVGTGSFYDASLVDDSEAGRRPVDQKGFADHVLVRDKPEEPAVLAVAAIIS